MWSNLNTHTFFLFLSDLQLPLSASLACFVLVRGLSDGLSCCFTASVSQKKNTLAWRFEDRSVSVWSEQDYLVSTPGWAAAGSILCAHVVQSLFEAVFVCTPVSFKLSVIFLCWEQLLLSWLVASGLTSLYTANKSCECVQLLASQQRSTPSFSALKPEYIYIVFLQFLLGFIFSIWKC